MNRKYFYFISAFAFLCFLLILVFFARNNTELEATQDTQVETPSFLTYITGSGIVEPVSGNIMISSPLNRTVEKINVSVNDQVKKGDVLFELYNQDLKANLRIKQLQYEESLSNLRKLESFPREEDLTIAQENLNRAHAIFNESVLKYSMDNRCAKSQEEACINLYNYMKAEAEFIAAQAQFDKIKSGTWKPELKIAKDAVEQAKADLEVTKIEIERTYVKSPIDGTILQIKIHEGEILNPSKNFILVGNMDALNLRVGIDQFNAQKFRPDCRAIAFKQGDNAQEIRLKFLYVEPVMVPKKYLTNELHERVDTQVFEIVYRIEKNDAHLFIGEQMDVYIYVDQDHSKNVPNAPVEDPNQSKNQDLQ